MTYENILVETHGKVGLIRLNRPKALNALNDQLMNELGEALLTFDADEQIGCIVVTGNEKAFAAGADIAAMASYTFMDVYKGEYITRNWEQIRRVRKPIIAAVAGYALLLFFAYALSWVMAVVGLWIRTPEVFNNASFIVIFPLSFIANTFVETTNLPGPLKVIAEWNPVSAVTQAVRELFGNTNPAMTVPDAWPLQWPQSMH